MPMLPARTPAAVHPWAARFAQGITGLLCLEAIVFQTPAVVAVAALLVAFAAIGPRYSPVAYLFAMLPVRPAGLEPSAPVRFAQMIANSMLTVATVLLYTGPSVAGWTVTGVVSGVALLSAISGICVGCIAWKQIVRRVGSAHDLREAFGLRGEGPWLIIVTAPDCPRCGPAKAAIEDAAAGRDVVTVDLSEHPEAGALPIWSVPAGVIVERSGAVGLVKTGTIGAAEARDLVRALG
ncbi:MAG: DUF4395 domain-containing protein [Thermoleophilia bacterium]|nr:DUF4395 domain-containing protein [Thermoleophilia bacterium]